MYVAEQLHLQSRCAVHIPMAVINIAALNLETKKENLDYLYTRKNIKCAILNKETTDQSLGISGFHTFFNNL